MFSLAEAKVLLQGSTERTWNCVLEIIHILWEKFNHISRPIMPKSRKRHHSKSKSRSYSREREHKKIGSSEKEKDNKRRRINSAESVHCKRSVSLEPEGPQCEIMPRAESSSHRGELLYLLYQRARKRA